MSDETGTKTIDEKEVEVTDKVDRKSDDKEDTQKVYSCNKTELKKRNSYIKM